MINFLLSLMCITGLHNQTQCPTQTPISNYQLEHIWNPTSPFEYISNIYGHSYYTKDETQKKNTTLGGRKLRIAAIVDPPYVTEISVENGTLAGHANLTIQALRKSLGWFDYQIIKPEVNVIGVQDENTGKWNGILGLLQNGEADFSIQFISILQSRRSAAVFSTPLGLEKWVIMMQRPIQTTDGGGLLIPFTMDVWWALLIALLSMPLLAYLVVRIRAWITRAQPPAVIIASNNAISFGHCIWFIYGAILKQGSVLKPFADSIRIFFASWWLFVTIVTGFYTANLTAYLTLSKAYIPYDGLATIPYRKSWMATEGDTIHQILIEKSTPNLATGAAASDETYYYKVPPPFPEFTDLRWSMANGRSYGSYLNNLSTMVERVRNKGELLFEEQTRVEHQLFKDFRAMTAEAKPLNQRCTFIMSIQPILELSYGFAFSPSAVDVLEIMDPVLRNLTEFGLFHHWRRLGLPIRDPCNNANKDFRERKLRNGDLWNTYMLVVIGYGLGFLSFLFEQAHHVLYHRKIKDGLKGMMLYKGNLIIPIHSNNKERRKVGLDGKNLSGKEYAVMKGADGRARLVLKNQSNDNADDVTLVSSISALQPPYNYYSNSPPPRYSYFE